MSDKQKYLALFAAIWVAMQLGILRGRYEGEQKFIAICDKGEIYRTPKAIFLCREEGE